ncbi:MAG: thioredoxin domain-containing protein, partial [Chloroflexota bacterium]
FRELLDTFGPEDARVFAAYYGASEGGNFEGVNILNVSRNPQAIADALGMPAGEMEAVLSRCRPRLLAVRGGRARPGLDDKTITAWNGLMLRSFAEAAAALDRSDYRDTAVANAEFVTTKLYRDGRLLRTHRSGEAKLNAYLEDYAFLADGLLATYELTFDPRWFRTAVDLTETMIRLFWDDAAGGFFDTSTDHETLISRPKEVTDNAIPSGNSVAAGVLLRLARLTGRADFEERTRRMLELLADYMRQHPTAFGRLLCVLDDFLAPSQEIAIVGGMTDPATQGLLSVVWGNFLPHKVVALAAPEDRDAAEAIPLLRDRGQVDGRATAYVCENFACLLPVTDPEALAGQLGLAATPA